LSHPNIVPIYDRGETGDGVYYIAMEYLPGGTLKQRITREGKLEPEVAAGVTYQVSDALQAAHERGVIHRDIKSQNIFLTESGDVKVGDFGIARAASATVTFGTSMILGTASYMSPEQALGEPATPRSDLYSLGIVLYEMLTGELPYMADSPVAVSLKHVKDPPKIPGEAEPTTPQAMNTIVARLLAKDPDARYASAAALMDDLERMRDGLPLAATLPETAPNEPTVALRAVGRQKKSRRRPILAVAVVAALALLGVGAWEFSYSSANQTPWFQVQEVANRAPAALPEAPEIQASNEDPTPKDQASGDQTSGDQGPEDAPTAEELFDFPDTPPEDQSTASASAPASAFASASATASATASPTASASASPTASASASSTPAPTPESSAAPASSTPAPTPESSAAPAPEDPPPTQPQPRPTQPQPRPVEPVRPEVPVLPDIPIFEDAN
nr:serine/threonine protein kinase [Rubrobacter sp.]